MADIATVFHWPPSELLGMPLGEIMKWRKEAIDRLVLLADLRRP